MLYGNEKKYWSAIAFELKISLFYLSSGFKIMLILKMIMCFSFVIYNLINYSHKGELETYADDLWREHIYVAIILGSLERHNN